MALYNKKVEQPLTDTVDSGFSETTEHSFADYNYSMKDPTRGRPDPPTHNYLSHKLTDESGYHSGEVGDSKPVPKSKTDRPEPAREMDSVSSGCRSSASDDHGYHSGTPSTNSSSSSGGSGKTVSSSIAQKAKEFPTTTPVDCRFADFEKFFQWLLSHKPKWTEWTPNTDIAKQLDPKRLEEGRSLLWETVDEDGDCEALNAARDGDENVVAMAVLIAPHHKKLNYMNKLRQTLLHLTAYNDKCSAKLSRLIITRGADGAIPDVWGNTPLHIACARGRADVITALCLPLTKPEVKHPYYKCPYKSLPQDNVNSYNHDGRAPIHLAAEVRRSLKHREAIAAMHMYAKVNMDYRRLGDGYSASHIAIDNDDDDCLQVCLEAKADSEVRNYKGETPQQLAYVMQYRRMVKMCQKYGAGAYQLEHAETEPVVDSDEEDMDTFESDTTDEEYEQYLRRLALTHKLQSLNMAKQ